MTQTAMPTLSSGATEGPTTAGSTSLSDAASRSPSMILSISGKVLITTSSSVIHENMTAMVIHTGGSGSNSLTNTTQVPTSSMGKSSTSHRKHPAAVQTVASATNPITRPPYMSSTSNHNRIAGSTLTVISTYNLSFDQDHFFSI